jgi:hypothetical protein
MLEPSCFFFFYINGTLVPEVSDNPLVQVYETYVCIDIIEKILGFHKTFKLLQRFRGQNKLGNTGIAHLYQRFDAHTCKRTTHSAVGNAIGISGFSE